MLARIVKAQKSAAVYGPALYGTDLGLMDVMIGRTYLRPNLA